MSVNVIQKALQMSKDFDNVLQKNYFNFPFLMNYKNAIRFLP